MTKRTSQLALILYIALLGLPANAQTDGELTIDLIDHRLSALSDAGAGDEDETVRTYSEARGFLIQAESQAREAVAAQHDP